MALFVGIIVFGFVCFVYGYTIAPMYDEYDEGRENE